MRSHLASLREMVRIRRVSWLLMLVLVAACGNSAIRDPSQAETCAEIEDLYMDAIQALIDLADQVPFDQLLESGIEIIGEENMQPWMDVNEAIRLRATELACNIDDSSFLSDRAGELTSETRSGEYMIEVLEGKSPPLP